MPRTGRVDWPFEELSWNSSSAGQITESLAAGVIVLFRHAHASVFFDVANEPAGVGGQQPVHPLGFGDGSPPAFPLIETVW